MNEQAHTFLRGAARPDLLRDETLAAIFAESVARHAHKPCLSFDGETLTYAEVDARAAEIARGLACEGVRAGDVVGLWAPRGPDLLIAQIAVAMTGAAWLPFDAEAPVERIAACLADAQARALVVSDDFLPRVEGRVDCDALTFGDLAMGGAGPRPDARANGASPDTTAYMIYTSGSTGVPKGIVISNRNICHFLRAVNEVYRLGPDDVMFQTACVAFDLSMEEIWLPLLVGASLRIASSDEMADFDALPEVMEAAGVTAIDTVPTLLSLLPRDVTGLRTIILGGEACPPALVERWSRPGRALYNTYGPTEATVVATIAAAQPGAPVTIGRPIANYTCYIVDDMLAPVAPGVEGELLIGGPGVAQGYLQRPDLTQAKFIANPFSGEGGDPVLYRSGDAVVLNASGDLEFRGRVDDQVKIRGFRVELGEIEARLVQLPGVLQAAVALREVDGLEQLVAFIVCRGAFDTRLARATLRLALPAYMVPARFEQIADLPRLPSGKTDRKTLAHCALPAPASARVA